MPDPHPAAHERSLKRIVFYDVARLLNRAGAATPTGIDRVDIRYLEHFIAQEGTEVVGVVQRHGRLTRLPPRQFDRLRGMLRRSWLGDGAPARPETRRAKRLKLRSTLRGSMSRFWKWRKGTALERLLDPALLALADASPDAEALYVNCSHNGINSPRLFEAIRHRLNAKLAVFVHDVLPIDHPQYFREGSADRHAQRMELVAKTADLVLTNSTYSRDRFVAFCTSEGISEPPGTVLHIGVEPAILKKAGMAAEAAASDPPYFVALGTIEPRKNLSLLLRVWKGLRAEGGPVPQLRLIGRRGWVTEENRDFDRLLAAVAGDVVELGPLDDTAMISQLAGARALLFPSFAEGWGMPLVEAQTLGTPVIASDIPAFREAAQGLAELLPPTEAARWTEAVRRYAAPGSAEPARRRAALAGFSPPTWQDHFARLESALARP